MSYHPQMGSGIVIYRGAPNQRGHGIGSFLKGLFRSSLPYLKKGAMAVGKELASEGVNFFNDVDHNVPPSEALRQRANQVKQNLKRKAINTIMGGGGYKKKKRRKRTQSKARPSKRRTSRKTKSKKKVRKVRKTNRKTKRKTKRGKKSVKKFKDIFGSK